jgi:peptidoglycan/LPS O-acetylase OafA/YrhL
METSAKVSEASTKLGGARRQQILGLDALRLMAAMLVMFYHFGFWHWTRGNDLLANAFGARRLEGWRWLNFGWVGVEIFFVISGLVIAYSAYGAKPSAFARSRFLRLVPGVLVCATISLILYRLILPRPLRSLLFDYFSTIVFWPFRSIDAVYWTLGIEIVFYALVYLMLRRDRLKDLEVVIFAIGMVSGLFWIAALTLAFLLDGSAGLAGTLHFLVLKAEGTRYLQLLLVQHGCFFALGVILYLAWANGLTPWRVRALLLLTGACLLEIVGQNTIIARASGEALSPVPAIAAWLAAIGFLIGSIRMNNALVELLGRRANFVRFGGRMTYPLYLIHNTIGLSVCVLLAPYVGLYAIPIALLSALVAAGLVELFPEKFIRRRLAERFIGRWFRE